MMNRLSNKEMTMAEQKQLQLEILLEIDSFCKSHGIVYSLAYGTLLGAIRHKGYIPWDDDLDIMMTLPDMLKFIKEFNSENLICYSYLNDKTYENPYCNICSNKTYRKDGRKVYRGLGIDLYPLVAIPYEENDKELYFVTANKLNSIRHKYLTWAHRINKILPNFYIPGFSNAITRFSNYALYSIPFEYARNYYLVARPMNKKDQFNSNILQSIILASFEGHSFPITSDYNEVLTTIYGNYMELPPENKRVPHHGQTYYWK